MRNLATHQCLLALSTHTCCRSTQITSRALQGFFWALLFALVPVVASAQVGREFVTVEAYVGSARFVHIGKILDIKQIEYEKPLTDIRKLGKPHRLVFEVSETIRGEEVKRLELVLSLQSTHFLEYMRDQSIEVMLLGGPTVRDKYSGTEIGIEEEGKPVDDERYQFRLLDNVKVLYGTFTMGYPPSRKESDEEFYATIQFREPKLTLTTKPVRLKIPAQKSDRTAVVATVDSLTATDLPGEWVDSDNGDLSLRLRAKSELLTAQDSIFVIAEIRNNRTEPMTILRPFIGNNQLVTHASQIKIWGEHGQIEYKGPIADYELNKSAFITLAAKEIANGTLELPVKYFAETGKAGNYVVRYDYSYSGEAEAKVAEEGVKGIWHGAISTREVQVLRK